MKKLTFCLFSSNDNIEEQDRLNLCLNSLLNQDTNESQVLFLDASAEGKTFKVPDSPDLQVVQRPTKQDANWNRSVIRNDLALMVETPILCQICADCMYSPNFASTLIKIIGEGNKILCCRRKRAEKDNWNKLRHNPSLANELGKSLPHDTPAACGECQCMTKQDFLAIGGYYNLIGKGISTKGKWQHTAAKDDTYLMHYIRKTGPYQKVQHDIKEIWIDTEPDVWIIHLWHPERQAAKDWASKKWHD